MKNYSDITKWSIPIKFIPVDRPH